MDRRTRIEAAKEWFSCRTFHWLDGVIACVHRVDDSTTVTRPATPEEVVAWANRLVTGTVGEIRKGAPRWK